MFRILDDRDKIALQEDISKLAEKTRKQLTDLNEKHDADKYALENELRTSVQILTDTHKTDKEALEAAISNEISRASMAESKLDDRITNVNNTLQENIDTLTDTHNKDKAELSKAINDEVSRAEKAETDLDVKFINLTNTLQDNINALSNTHTNDKEALSTAISDEVLRSTTIDSEFNERINTLDGGLDELTKIHNEDKKLFLDHAQRNEDSIATLATKVANDIEVRIATMEVFFKEADINAEQDFIDTLKEIQSYIDSDKTGAAAMAESIQNNKDAIANEEKRAIAAESQCLSEAKTYADEKKRLIDDAYAEADAQVLSSAKSYTNEQKRLIDEAYAEADTQVLSSAQSYADTAEADAISTSKAYTDELANGQVATNTAAISTLTKTHNDDKEALEGAIGAEKLRAEGVESNLDGKINTLQNSINTLTETKVDKDGDKVLTDNNLTDELKATYDAAYEHSQNGHAPADAEKNVQSDWNNADETSAAYILNKPSLGALAGKDVVEKTDLSEEVQGLLGQTISMQVADGYIQYSVDGGVTWINLLALSDITA